MRLDLILDKLLLLINTTTHSAKSQLLVQKINVFLITGFFHTYSSASDKNASRKVLSNDRSPSSSSPRLDTKVSSSMEEQVDEVHQKIE